MSTHIAYPSSTDLSTTTSMGTKEIDIRDVLDRFLHGSSVEEAHGGVYILRIVRRDSDDNKTICQCRRNGQPEGDYRCQYCQGVGFFFDEETVICYRAPLGIASTGETFNSPGLLTAGTCMFYFEAGTLMPRRSDFIIEPKIDIAGKIANPVKIMYYWDIDEVYPFRSDRLGRIEYYRVIANRRPETSES